MTQNLNSGWGYEDGWFVASLDETTKRGYGPSILSPVTATLHPRLADMACTLPIGDANGRLLDALDGSAAAHRVLAAVLACDPFRRVDDLLDALWNAGARAVINWPCVGLLSGELGAALTHSGFTYAREMAMLERARYRGLSPAAVVSNEEQLTEALAIRPDLLLIVPGLVATKAEARQARVAEIEQLLQLAASRSPETDLRLYPHPVYGAALESVAHRARGVIRHAGPVQASP